MVLMVSEIVFGGGVLGLRIIFIFALDNLKKLIV